MAQKNFMNNDNRIHELVAERRLWVVAKKDVRNASTFGTARRSMEAMKSDPFAYNRVIAHLSNDVFVPEDYKVK